MENLPPLIPRRFSTSLRAQFGVTFVEIIVVVAISGVLLGIGLPLTWDFYLRNELRAEQGNIAAYLKLARARALANRHQSAHGVFFATTTITVFEGASYAARNATYDVQFPRAGAVRASGTQEFAFQPLSGRTASTSIVLFAGEDTRSIFITSEGLIE